MAASPAVDEDDILESYEGHLVDADPNQPSSSDVWNQEPLMKTESTGFSSPTMYTADSWDPEPLDTCKESGKTYIEPNISELNTCSKTLTETNGCTYPVKSLKENAGLDSADLASLEERSDTDKTCQDTSNKGDAPIRINSPAEVEEMQPTTEDQVQILPETAEIRTDTVQENLLAKAETKFGKDLSDEHLSAPDESGSTSNDNSKVNKMDEQSPQRSFKTLRKKFEDHFQSCAPIASSEPSSQSVSVGSTKSGSGKSVHLTSNSVSEKSTSLPSAKSLSVKSAGVGPPTTSSATTRYAGVTTKSTRTKATQTDALVGMLLRDSSHYVCRPTIPKASQTSPQQQLLDDTLCRQWLLSRVAEEVVLSDRAVQTEVEVEGEETKTQLSLCKVLEMKMAKQKALQAEETASAKSKTAPKSNSTAGKTEKTSKWAKVQSNYQKVSTDLPKKSRSSRKEQLENISKPSDAVSSQNEITENKTFGIAKIVEFWSSKQPENDVYESSMSATISNHSYRQTTTKQKKSWKPPITQRNVGKKETQNHNYVSRPNPMKCRKFPSPQSKPARVQRPDSKNTSISSAREYEALIFTNRSANRSKLSSDSNTLSPPAVKYERLQPTDALVKLWSHVIDNHQQEVAISKISRHERIRQRENCQQNSRPNKSQKKVSKKGSGSRLASDDKNSNRKSKFERKRDQGVKTVLRQPLVYDKRLSLPADVSPKDGRLAKPKSQIDRSFDESVEIRKSLPQISRSSSNVRQMEQLLQYIHQTGEASNDVMTKISECLTSTKKSKKEKAKQMPKGAGLPCLESTPTDEVSSVKSFECLPKDVQRSNDTVVVPPLQLKTNSTNSSYPSPLSPGKVEEMAPVRDLPTDGKRLPTTSACEPELEVENKQDGYEFQSKMLQKRVPSTPVSKSSIAKLGVMVLPMKCHSEQETFTRSSPTYECSVMPPSMVKAKVKDRQKFISKLLNPETDEKVETDQNEVVSSWTDSKKQRNSKVYPIYQTPEVQNSKEIPSCTVKAAATSEELLSRTTSASTHLFEACKSGEDCNYRPQRPPRRKRSSVYTLSTSEGHNACDLSLFLPDGSLPRESKQENTNKTLAGERIPPDAVKCQLEEAAQASNQRKQSTALQPATPDVNSTTSSHKVDSAARMPLLEASSSVSPRIDQWVTKHCNVQWEKTQNNHHMLNAVNENSMEPSPVLTSITGASSVGTMPEITSRDPSSEHNTCPGSITSRGSVARLGNKFKFWRRK